MMISKDKTKLIWSYSVNKRSSSELLFAKADNEPIFVGAKLHHWYLYKIERDDDIELYIAFGNVTGHNKLPDTIFTHTSNIKTIHFDQEAEKVIIQTLNTEYHCLLSECNFSKKDTYELIPCLKEYSKKNLKNKYEQEDNSILIVLSDHETYYFETAIIKKDGKDYLGMIDSNIGRYQDSCIIRFREYTNVHGRNNDIDIRYFPHHQHLETYSWCTQGLPVYLENAGDDVIYYTTDVGVIELKPGDSKLVCKENTIQENELPLLDQEDLY